MKLTYAELKQAVATYVAENKIATDTFEITRANSVGLVDKIGKIITLDTHFIDKMSVFDGEELSFGKTIEEWFEDLKMPEDYDSNGDGALAPHRGTYQDPTYSYSIGRKKIAITIDNNDIERAVHNEGQFVDIISMKSKRLQDSYITWRYATKRQMVAVLINKCEEALANDSTLNLVQSIAVPTDTETSEAFIKQIKMDVELASDYCESNSLNGNSKGATEGLVLLVKQGIVPVLQVEALAGAFQKEELAVPAEIITIKDFGDDTSGAYAVLLDKRGLRLHNTYKAVRENFNGDGDFLNMFMHFEDTPFISRNTFVKVYKALG